HRFAACQRAGVAWRSNMACSPHGPAGGLGGAPAGDRLDQAHFAEFAEAVNVLTARVLAPALALAGTGQVDVVKGAQRPVSRLTALLAAADSGGDGCPAQGRDAHLDGTMARAYNFTSPAVGTRARHAARPSA